jgi:hypothetical protein
LRLVSLTQTAILISRIEGILFPRLSQYLLLTAICGIFLGLSASLCIRLFPVGLLLSEGFDQRRRLDLVLGSFVLCCGWFGDGVGKALEEVLEFLVLVDGALAIVVSPSAARHLRVRGVLQCWGTDEGGVLPGLGSIVEGDSADVVAKRLDMVLLGNVYVCAGWFRGFGGAEVALAVEVAMMLRGQIYSVEILPFL